MFSLAFTYGANDDQLAVTVNAVDDPMRSKFVLPIASEVPAQRGPRA
jgi:hypothetical protein